jgi:hypothetical protein
MSDKPKDWVQEARRRCDRATPGPWRRYIGPPANAHAGEFRRGARTITGGPGDTLVADDPSLPGRVIETAGWTYCTENAAFIEIARTHLPRALDVIEAADALVKALADNERDRFITEALAAYKAVRR